MILRSRVTIGKYIVYCILVSLLVYIITNATMGFLKFNLEPEIILGVSAGVNILFYIFYTIPYAGLGLGLSIPVSAAAYYFINKEYFIKLAVYLWELVRGCAIWFYEYMISTTPTPINKLYSDMVVIGFIVLLTILMFYLLIARHYTIFVLAAGVVYLCFLWFFGYDDAFQFVQQYIFAGFAAYGFINFDRLETGWRIKQDIYSRKIAIVWAVCIAVALGLVYVSTEILPNEIKPVNIQWLNDNVFSIFSGYGTRGIGGGGGMDDRFSISTVGFQEGPSKLGGAVKTSDKLLLKVKVDGTVDTPIYLRGAIRDTYSGSMWTKSRTEEKDISIKDEITGLTGMDAEANSGDIVTITVYPQAINTSTIFNLWKPYKVDANIDSYRQNGDGELYLGKVTQRNMQYKVTSRIPTVYSDELGRYSKSFKDLLQPYLQLPGMTERVINLTHSITDKYKTDYEKAVAIQDYLRTTYPYTLETSSVPDNRDFVDYFLFDEKKGYCTYYATAMAVMCRIAGIPSRYVEGFVLDYSNLNKDGLYEAKASKAHAWVEVYFDGYGWLKFEPTSAYQAANYTRPVNQNTENVPTYVPGNNQEQTDTDIQKGRKDLEDLDNSTGEIVEAPVPPWGLYAAIAIIALLILRVLQKIILEKRRVWKADELKDKDAASEYLLIFERKLKTAGIVRDAGETPVEFGSRIRDMMERFGVDILDVLSAFNRIRFGNSSMDDKAREKFKLAIRNADMFIKDRRGWIKYISSKYLL